jgi:hypothetical protein
MGKSQIELNAGEESYTKREFIDLINEAIAALKSNGIEFNDLDLFAYSTDNLVLIFHEVTNLDGLWCKVRLSGGLFIVDYC